jgi:hypothetical protein
MSPTPRVAVFSRKQAQILVVALLFLSWALGKEAIAQSLLSDKSGTSVHSKGGVVQLQTEQRTAISEVVRAVCAEENVSCIGCDLLASEILPPIVMEGTFVQIIQQLIDGLDVNFEYTHGDSERRSRLVLMHRTSVSLKTKQLPNPGSEPDAPEPLDASMPAPHDTGDDVPFSPSITTAAAKLGVNAQPTKLSAETLQMMQQMFAGGYATEVTPSEYLPFPGPDGRPIPAKPVNAEFLPFPDQFGRPIPITQSQPGSPFPITDIPTPK